MQIRLNDLRNLFENTLEEQIRYMMTPIEMLKPMVYSLKNGGKRLRPILLLAVLQIQNTDLIKSGLNTAIALEYIHTYSLIHDDLPAMDNDELRRGVPTNHIQFDEATAILAGDALLTDAFGIIVKDDLLSAEIKTKLVYELSLAAGSHGMVAGQLSDTQAKADSVALDDLETIHQLKTGKLFSFAVIAATIISEMKQKESELLVEFSEHFGKAYQIHNDLLDVLGTEIQTGKKVSADVELDKATYPAILGLEKAKDALKNECQAANQLLNQLSQESEKDYQALSVFVDLLKIEDKMTS